jgi:DNA-binding CsgD family transcriptional regulator
LDIGLQRITAQTTLWDTISAGDQEARRAGVVSASFHVTRPQALQTGPDVFIAAFGQPEEWMKAYRKYEFRRHDPIPDFIMRAGESMTFEEVLARITLTPDQAAFVGKLRATPLIDSVALPVYGPFDFDSYASFCLGRPITPEDEMLTIRLLAIAEVTNRRCAQLFQAEQAEKISFSPRETEVLNWMGRSKSTTDIATIMGVSTATIDTFVRRIFAKLEVNDRISAVLKGVRLGYIRF